MARLEFAHSDDRWHLPTSHCRAVGGTADDTGRDPSQGADCAERQVLSEPNMLHVAYGVSLSFPARSRRCSRVYSSSSETPNSSNITPQITSIDASMRARLVAGTMSP